eukprot:NODE_11321_length_466_cov_0.725664_g11298_i0.p2 GENE.NODE_11321_length_466_cov_0.725664_g11298_i0~~NODE_11321_length_466_cov_0.725664_g11298_i0.p2  ORF type:complete len:114 (-),score=16.19 NODE_11321_length_466_cov_0.725664_g11298_i0:22-363(-)
MPQACESSKSECNATLRPVTVYPEMTKCPHGVRSPLHQFLRGRRSGALLHCSQVVLSPECDEELADLERQTTAVKQQINNHYVAMTRKLGVDPAQVKLECSRATATSVRLLTG